MAAARPESGWVNSGGSARSDFPPSVLNTGGIEYTAVTGLDHRIWVSYNGNPYRQIPVAHETRDAPTVVTIAGRITVFHTGVDGAIYYTLLQNLENNNWSGWTRVPGNAVATGTPAVSVLMGNVASVTVLTVNGRLATQRMEIQPGGISYRTNYTELANWQLPTNLPAGENTIFSWTWFNRAGNRELYINIAAVGMDHHVWTGGYNVNNPNDTVAPTPLPGGGVCNSSVAVARGGPPDRVASPGDPGYHNMSHQALACIGTDGNVWENQSSDGGANWGGWNRTTDGAGPSRTGPSLWGAGNTIGMGLSWNATASPRFPDDAIVEKSLF
ncbi:hypothetical protein [Streptomyces sp. NRRL S-495]|uniref:hypothetical protein n=1 Tax=Streptomyces sp. NRRL S-495 TaxID=1609133 RepID=UPI0005F9853A|nr:hypothetical protein [Streptomyces sp. NRRL S-495]KJY37340.1 hypothetical protein VR45_09180 [Streptomyces sp. NRRL S-495]